MALLLVQLADNSGNGSAGEQLASGDVVRVLEGRHDVGARQSRAAWIASGKDPAQFPMGFVLVDVIDMTEEEAEQLIVPYPLSVDPGFQLDAEGNPIFQYARRWGFVASGIALDRQAELMTTGELTTTKALVSAAIMDKAGFLNFGDL